METKINFKELIIDALYVLFAGTIVGTAYFIFQNSNGFAPGGVGGLATIVYYLIGNDNQLIWSLLMIGFNIPIFVLVSIFINKKLGIMLSIYLFVQSFISEIYILFGVQPYCLANNLDDFNIVFACIATGVISGFGFSLMLRRFGASGGTYGISALVKRFRPETNIAYISFIMDASVVFISFSINGKITPVICTLLNLFIANIIVDNVLNGVKNGYKFEIITAHPDKIAAELMQKLGHGVTEIRAHGMYSDTDKYMLVCIINKWQIGDMMRIIKKYPDTFASYEKVNEVFGNFKRKHNLFPENHTKSKD